MVSSTLLRVTLTAAAMIGAVNSTPVKSIYAEHGRAIVLDREPFEASLADVDADWNVTFEVSEGRRKVAAEKLIYWGGYSDRDRGRQVLLVDGSSVSAAEVVIQNEQIGISSNLWLSVNLPLEAVSGIIFHPPADALQRDLLARRIRLAEGDEDQLLLENGDSIRGLIVSLSADAQPLPPNERFKNDQPLIHLNGRGGEIAIPVDKLIAIVLNPALRNRANLLPTRGLVGFRDGSLLRVAKISPDRDAAVFTLSGGVLLTCDPLIKTIWDEVVLLQPMTGQVAYLSDLKPIGYKHIPFLELSWPYGVDRNVLQGRLRSDDQLFAKGIAMHSISRLAFDLDRPYRKFQADLAIDEAAGLQGSVVFRVFAADATGQLRLIYKSPIVRGGEKPLSISADITGARRIALIVDLADRGDVMDHADWLNARLIK